MLSAISIWCDIALPVMKGFAVFEFDKKMQNVPNDAVPPKDL